VETSVDQKLVGRHCSQYVRIGSDQSSSDQDDDESQVDQDESDSEYYDQPDQERVYHKFLVHWWTRKKKKFWVRRRIWWIL